MELLALVRLEKVGSFVTCLMSHVMSHERAYFSGGVVGLKAEDASDTFVSVKFSRSFV